MGKVFIFMFIFGAFNFMIVSTPVYADDACAPLNCPVGATSGVEWYNCKECVTGCCDDRQADQTFSCGYVDLGGWPDDKCILNGTPLYGGGCTSYDPDINVYTDPDTHLRIHCALTETREKGCCPGGGGGGSGGGTDDCSGKPIPAGGCGIYGCGNNEVCVDQHPETGAPFCGCRAQGDPAVAPRVLLDQNNDGNGDLDVYTGSMKCSSGDIEIAGINFRTINGNGNTADSQSVTDGCPEIPYDPDAVNPTYPVYSMKFWSGYILEVDLPSGYEIVRWIPYIRWDGPENCNESGCGCWVPPGIPDWPEDRLYCPSARLDSTYIPMLIIRQACSGTLATPTNLRIASPTDVVISGGVNRICSSMAAGPTLTWSAVTDADKYVVRVTNSLGTVVNDVEVSGTSYSIPTVLPAGEYQTSVWAKDVCDNLSSTPASYAFTVVSRPASVTGLTANDLIDNVSVKWTDNSTNEKWFEIQRQSVSGPFNFPNKLTDNESGLGYMPQYEVSDTTAATGLFSYCVRSSAGAAYPNACRVSDNWSECYSLSILDYSSWFSVRGGDIVAVGDISMMSPPASQIPAPIWIRRGEPPPPTGGTALGSPGIAFARSFINVIPAADSGWVNETDLDWSGEITGWSSGVMSRVENNYLSLNNRVIPRISNMTAGTKTGDGTITLTDNDLNIWIAGSTATKTTWLPPGVLPVTVLHVKDANLILSEPTDIGDKRALIYVDGDVNIKGTLTVDVNPGFLAIIAGGDIYIDAAVGVDVPAAYPFQEDITDPNYDTDLSDSDKDGHINAVLYAEGAISTGTVGFLVRDKQLKILGSLVGLDGVNLQRQSKGLYPAEFIQFSPYLTRILREVGLRRIVRQMLVAP